MHYSGEAGSGDGGGGGGEAADGKVSEASPASNDTFCATSPSESSTGMSFAKVGIGWY